MTLEQLKVRLGIPLDDTSQDTYLQALLDDAIAWLQLVCGQNFENSQGIVELPKALYSIVTDLIKFQVNEQGFIKSESIAGMNQTFVTFDELQAYLTSKLSQLGLRRVRFTPFNKNRSCY